MACFFRKMTTKEPSVFECACACVSAKSDSCVQLFKTLNVVKTSSLYGCEHFFFFGLEVIFEDIIIEG